MVRVQLYLPDVMYDDLKLKARRKKMSFASYVRSELGEEKYRQKDQRDVYERFPFLKVKFNLGPACSDNKAIDEFLYLGPNGPA